MTLKTAAPAATEVSRQPVRKCIALAGNPNVGKSVIFSALTVTRAGSANCRR